MRWLISCADIITPNITEVALLLDEPFTPRISPEKSRAGAAACPQWDLKPWSPQASPCWKAAGTPDKIPRSLPMNATRTAFGASIAHISPPTTPARGTRSPACSRAASFRATALSIALDRAVQFVTLGIRATFGQGWPSREGILLERILGSLFAPVSTCKCRIMDGDGCCNPVLPFED